MSDLLEMLTTGEQNVSRLTDPNELRNAANQVAEFARSRGVTSLHAASPAAERIVGAALVSAPNGQDMLAVDCADSQSTALVVDVNLASGTALAHAARRVRQSGAAHVVAAVLHQLSRTTLVASDCYVDELVVLQGDVGA